MTLSLNNAWFVDRGVGKGVLTTAINNSPPGEITVVTGEKKSGSAAATTVVLVVTANVGDTLLAWVYSHDDTVTSVTAASGVSLGFTARGSASTHLKFFIGRVDSAMVGVNVTATVSGTNGASFIVLPIRGAYNSTMAFFDPNSALPFHNGPNDSTGQNSSITTTNPRTMLVYACAAKGPLVNLTDPSGWTGIANTGYVNADLATWYKLVNAAQNGLAVAAGTSDAHETESYGDAINGQL